MRFRPTDVRARLTLWYVGMLAAMLALFAAGTSVLLFWQLRVQLGHYAIQDVETVEGLLSFTPGGRLQLREDYHNHPESRRVLEHLLEVRTPGGALLLRNDRLGNRTLGGKPFPNEGVGGYSVRSERLADGVWVRMVSRSHSVDGHPTVIRLAYEEAPLWVRLEELWAAALLVLPVALGIAGWAGYALAGRALAPLAEMTRRAAKITEKRLDERLPVENPDDEIGQLARVFNTTLGRLEQAFAQLRQFTADASHELRTPLASIRSVGEVGLQQEISPAEYRDVIGSMLEEVNRLTRLVDHLLVLSRADAGAVEFHMSIFPVRELATEALALIQVLVEEKSQQVTLTGDESILVEGDRLFLRQALVNILHNAVRYSPPGAYIQVLIRRDGPSSAPGRVVMEIADDGPGIPAEHARHIFDRFYRVDKSRARAQGGAGLGLAIAQWAVEAHGGTISLDTQRGVGSTFQILLPAR
jgi:heavy metal sensor kinase